TGRPSPRRCPPRLGAVRIRPDDPGPRAPRRPRARGEPWPTAESPPRRDPDGPPADRSGEAPRLSPGALRAPDARRRAGRSKPRGSSLPASRPVRPVLDRVAFLFELCPNLIGSLKILSQSSFVTFVELE